LQKVQRVLLPCVIYLLVVSIRSLHKEKIYTRTLGSAGDFAGTTRAKQAPFASNRDLHFIISSFRDGALFCARHLGAGDNLRTTVAAASIRPTFVGWASVLRCQLLRECYFLDNQ